MVGVGIIACHNLMDAHVGGIVEGLEGSSFAGLWKIVYVGLSAGPVTLGSEGPSLFVLYTIVPWIGVMAAGYAFGTILTGRQRNRLCAIIGAGAIGVFVVLRGFNLYGDPRPWHVPLDVPEGSKSVRAVLAFLNTSKYPASLQFLLMTLGPVIAVIPLLENARGPVARWIATFGRVPFFFYLLHVPLIHVLAIVVSLLRLGEVSPWLFGNHPVAAPPAPDNYAWSLPLLDVVWAVTIGMLYLPCRWFARIKAASSQPLLRFL